jgi:hypothetical protein
MISISSATDSPIWSASLRAMSDWVRASHERASLTGWEHSCPEPDFARAASGRRDLGEVVGTEMKSDASIPATVVMATFETSAKVAEEKGARVHE